MFRNVIQERLKILTSENGSPTASFSDANGVERYLHSIYDPEREAVDMLSHIKIEENVIYIVYGFGLGYHVKELLKRVGNDVAICIVEPDREYSFSELSRSAGIDLSWMSDKRIHMIYADNSMVAVLKVIYAANIFLACKTVAIFHYPTISFFEQTYDNIIKTFNEELAKNVLFRMQTLESLRKVLLVNFWKNLPDIIKNAGVAELYGVCRGIPAIIVASGPSLDKNIHQLRGCKEKAVIIAVGSALGALKRSDVDILPHAVVIVDPFPVMFSVLKPHIDDAITLVTEYSVDSQFLQHHHGNKFFFSIASPGSAEKTDFNIMHEILRTKGNFLASTISAATSAFSLAWNMGCDPIIFVGQDLAMPEAFYAHYKKNREETSEKSEVQEANVCFENAFEHHAKGVETKSFIDDVSRMIEVEGNNGNKLFTSMAFNMVIENFNNMFGALRSQGYTIVNATEGGALIKGTEILTLAKAKKKYLRRDYDVREIFLSALEKKKKKSLRKLKRVLNNLKKWLDSSLVIWQKEFKKQVDNKDIEFCEKTEKELIFDEWDRNINQFRNSNNYEFIASYLEVPMWKYKVALDEVKCCEDDEERFISLKKQYFILLIEINEVLLFLQAVVHDTVKNFDELNKNDGGILNA